MTKKQKLKKRERTTCPTDLTHKKPPKLNGLCISSVKKRLSPPLQAFPTQPRPKKRCPKKWVVCCSRLPTRRRSCGIAGPYCYGSYRAKTPCRLAFSEALPSAKPFPQRGEYKQYPQLQTSETLAVLKVSKVVLLNPEILRVLAVYTPEILPVL